jgi:DNA-binding CsgD family transcriptional regulator
VDAVAEKLEHHAIEIFHAPRLEILSNREQEIMDLLCQGLNIKEIAAKLCISKHTAASHQTNIHRKLGVRDKGQLLRLCHIKTEKPSDR